MIWLAVGYWASHTALMLGFLEFVEPTKLAGLQGFPRTCNAGGPRANASRSIRSTRHMPSVRPFCTAPSFLVSGSVYDTQTMNWDLTPHSAVRISSPPCGEEYGFVYRCSPTACNPF